MNTEKIYETFLDKVADKLVEAAKEEVESAYLKEIRDLLIEIRDRLPPP